MKKIISIFITLLLTGGLYIDQAIGVDLTLTTGGRVTIELISSDAAFHNTLSIVSPNVAIATAPDGTNLTGCTIESFGFGGLEIVSEKSSQHGCRVELDADPVAPGNQPFAAGTTLRFNLCAQTDADPACDNVWSSDPSLNSDGKDHVKTTTLLDGNYNLLAWEDRENLGDEDFDDLIAVVRVVQDSDGDGLWDDWEQSGIDTDGDGVVDFTLPDANWQHKDVYIEIDYMDCNETGGDCDPGDTHSHEPKAAAIAEVVQAFKDANVTNPDGFDGITLHVDVDDAIPHQNFVNIGCFTGGTADYDAIKDDPNFFGPDNPRRFAYHYVLFAHRQVSTSTASGCGELPGNDYIISLGDWNTDCIGPGNNDVLDTAEAVDDLRIGSYITTGPNLICDTTAAGDDVQFIASGNSPPSDLDGDGLEDRNVGTIREQSGTLMHELGHNLNLEHGGGDCTNYKPNYLSVMNYWFQFSGILPGGGLDYSREALPDLDEREIGGVGQLDEAVGIQDGTHDTRYCCPNWSDFPTVPGTGPIDWNCDGDGGLDPNVSVNINGDCQDTVRVNCGACDPGENLKLSQLAGYNDWENLKYDFQNSRNFEDGVHIDMDIPDMDFPTYLLHINQPPVCDANGPYEVPCQGTTTKVTLNGSGSSDPNAGDVLTYSWTTDCNGGSFDDSNSPNSVLTIDSSPGCFECNVYLTVTDRVGASDSCSNVVKIFDNEPPALTCPTDITIECDESSSPDDTGIATATDTCDSNPSVSYSDIETPGSCPQEKIISRTWTAKDACLNESSCVQTIEVVDTTAPVIFCNAPTTITPPDAPISFKASAEDNCDAAPVVEIITYDCFFYTKKGKRIDKTESCIIEVGGDTITILDSGGVGDHITWTVRATDHCGNVGEQECDVEVINPGKP